MLSDRAGVEFTGMARILVVDDDPHLREVLRYALVRDGHDVEEARDGAEALRLAAASRPDLLVLDIVMPGMDGLEACRELRKTSTVPVVFLSSRDEELDRVLGLEMGATTTSPSPSPPASSAPA